MADAASVLARGAPSLRALGRYGGLVAGANLAWEIAQLPFYTIWRDGTPGAISFAVLHCTAGDALIAMTSVAIALFVTGRPRWPATGAVRVGLVATALGAAYTVFSEWLNVSVRGSWAYAPEMPVLPPLGTGLFPLLQWLVLPPLCLALMGRAVGTGSRENGPRGNAP
jgi:hypothetical protein